MKKSSIIIVALLILVAVGLFFFQGEEEIEQGLWKDATYTEDTTLGSGEKVFYLVVKAGDKEITFTINTYENTVGKALKAVGIIEGEEGPYGIYIKKANGILADYDIDQSYWSFEKDGEAMLTGVDSTQFKDGDRFELVRTK